MSVRTEGHRARTRSERRGQALALAFHDAMVLEVRDVAALGEHVADLVLRHVALQLPLDALQPSGHAGLRARAA
jgi:hypothetical protein